MKKGSGIKATTSAMLLINDDSPKMFKAQPKRERALLYILQNPCGATENDILLNVGLSSGRNYFTQLERLCGIKFTREHIENTDGIGAHLRYSFFSLEIANEIVKEINESRVRRKVSPLSSALTTELLKPLNNLLSNTKKGR